jgi:hypothetical protein
MTMGSLVLLDLMGGVALLLWGLHKHKSAAMVADTNKYRHFLRFMAV